MDIMVAGTIQFVVVALMLGMVLTNRPRAAETASLVGFASAVLFTYAHVLPRYWPILTDSFVSKPHTGVTWFSWLTAIGEISTGIALGVAGIRARRTDTRTTRSPT